MSRLEIRRQQQAAIASGFKAFHDFQFADRLDESGIRFAHRIVDDAGVNYQAAHYDHGNAVAAADVDGDDRLDLYFTTQLGTNQLWRNLGGGRFEDLTVRAGVGLPNQISVGASFADLDNDGDPELFVTTVRHGNRLFENLGGGRFRDVSRSAGVGYVGHSSGAVFLDYDRDGLLDLFVVNVGVYTENRRGRGGYHMALPDAFQGHLHPARTEYSVLYRNLGKLTFRDVSREAGLRDGSWAGDATLADLNEDGFPELYLVNMQGDDHYYDNDGGRTFRDRTGESFPKTPWGAMGVKFFDVNRDGHQDLLVTDMHSDMTQPQTEQALQFRIETEKAKSEAFCMAQWPEDYYQGSTNNIFGNALYLGRGGGRFEEVSDALGTETYWPWGVSVGDINADGFDDVFVAAGMGYPFRYGINSLLLNEAGRRFFDAEFLTGIEPRSGRRTEKVWFTLDCEGVHRGHPMCAGVSGTTNILGTLSTRSSVMGDFDGDGDLDLVTNEFNDRPQILISNLSDRKDVRFLQVKLEGRISNRDGLGSIVTVRAGGLSRTATHDGKSGYLAQSSQPLYFGLGDLEQVEAVEVRWPSGRKTIAQHVAVNSTIRMVESTD